MFPRQRVSHRAWFRTKDGLLGLWWSPLAIGVLSAAVAAWGATTGSSTAMVGFMQVTVVPSWPRVFAAGLIGGAGFYLLFFLVAWFWKLLRYRLERRDEDWTNTASMTDDAVVFVLERRPEAPSVSIGDHGRMEVVVKAPDGVLRTLGAEELQPMADRTVVARIQGPGQSGDYEVRWYGSRRKWYYEVTRGLFRLAPDGRAGGDRLDKRAG